MVNTLIDKTYQLSTINYQLSTIMNGLIVFIGLFFILYIGQKIFIPLIVAVFIWYLLNAIAAYYHKIMPWRKSWFAGAMSFFLSIATFGALVYFFVTQIHPAIVGMMGRIPDIQLKLGALQTYLSAQFGVHLGTDWIPSTSQILGTVGAFATQFSAAFGLVLVYILFMYIEQSTFGKKFTAMFPDKRRSHKMLYIMQSIDANMKRYMFIKTAMSALTAGTAWIWMHFWGLEFAGVWAFIIFILNYIPTFGSIISIALPVLYSLLIAPSAEMPIAIASGLIGLNILIGNILEPRLTGKTLNLSTLAILINLVFWGMIWGPAGMFFSVPLLVATFIITAQFDSTRWIAVLLSANGEIPNKEDD